MKGIKILFLIFCTIFLIGIVSAELITFDNVKSYDAETKTITVKNLFGLGKTYADVKLNTPLDNLVGRGYRKVAEFTITSYADYNNILKVKKTFL